MRKGLWGSFPMLIMFAAVIVPGFFMMGDHTETIESAFDYHTNDVTQLSKASVYGSYMSESYIPRAYNLSVDRSIYTVGKRGAGVAWSSQNIPDNLNEVVENELEEQSKLYLQNYIEEADNKIVCSISSSYNSDLTPESNSKQVNSDKPSLICKGVNSEANYGLKKSIDMHFNDKTFFALTRNTASFFTQLNTEWSQNVEESYSDSTVKCGEKDYATPEEQAVDEAESDIKSTFSQVVSQHPENSDFAAESSIKGPSFSFDYGSNTEVFSADEQASSEDLGDCNCETCGSEGYTYPCNCETEYRTTVIIEPRTTNVEWLVKNNNQKILTQEGVENPLFHVKSYTQDYNVE